MTEVLQNINEDQPEDLIHHNPLHHKYTFWYRGGGGGGEKVQKINYNESIKQIATFHTVEQFWRIYDYLKRPHEFRVTTEFHLFREGIAPMWEDQENIKGGKWTIRLRKGIASHYWEEIVFAIIGEQFDVEDEICGAVISIRNNEDILSVWNKTADNKEAVEKIRDQMRRLLELPSIIAVEYKRHQESLVDNSSYRNPTMVYRAPTGNMNKGNSSNQSNTESNHHPHNQDGKFHHQNQQQKHNSNAFSNQNSNYHHNNFHPKNTAEGGGEFRKFGKFGNNQWKSKPGGEGDEVRSSWDTNRSGNNANGEKSNTMSSGGGWQRGMGVPKTSPEDINAGNNQSNQKKSNNPVAGGQPVRSNNPNVSTANKFPPPPPQVRPSPPTLTPPTTMGVPTSTGFPNAWNRPK